MRLRTLVLLTVVGLGGLGFAPDAEAQRHPRRSADRSYRSYRPAPRYSNYRYSRPYYNYSYRPYSYSYRHRPYGYGYSYDPYYYAPYYDPYYYHPRPIYRSYRPFYRPRVGFSIHLGW